MKMPHSAQLFPRVRVAGEKDLPAITVIYNQGIEDRTATLESEPKSPEEIRQWFRSRHPRYQVIVLEDTHDHILGWASLNPFHSRCSYDGVADLSIYLHRSARGKGLGKMLLNGLEPLALKNRFHKLVLSTFADNIPGKKLYEKQGFREVGTYYRQGILDGKWIDITVMEKMLI